MNIKTIDRNLYVIQVMNKSADYEYMLCTDLLEEKSNKYEVLKVMNYSMVYKVMPMLNAQLNNKKFSDLVDCFSQDNVFYAMFKHYEEPLLFDKLNDRYSTLERSEIVKNIIEKIVMLSMPYSMQTDILNSNSITISDTLEVHFKYNLKQISNYDSLDFKSLQGSLSKVVEAILHSECESGNYSLLTEYCKTLNLQEYTQPIELYSKYVAVYNQLKESNVDNTKPNKWLVFWNKIKYVVKLIKPCILCLIVFSAIAYLIYLALGYNDKDTSQYDTYKTIGTLDIKEYTSNTE